LAHHFDVAKSDAEYINSSKSNSLSHPSLNETRKNERKILTSNHHINDIEALTIKITRRIMLSTVPDALLRQNCSLNQVNISVSDYIQEYKPHKNNNE
jgi:hypothetical protein